MSVCALKEALNLKRFLYFPCVLCLVIGLLVGVLLPIDFQEDDKPAANLAGNNGFTPPPAPPSPRAAVHPPLRRTRLRWTRRKIFLCWAPHAWSTG